MDDVPDIRQSALALLGDLARVNYDPLLSVLLSSSATIIVTKISHETI